MYKIFGSFNDDILPGFKNFPNSKIIESLPVTKGIGLVNYIKENKKFDFANDDFFNLIEKCCVLILQKESVQKIVWLIDGFQIKAN